MKEMQRLTGTAMCCSECDYNVGHDEWRFGGEAGRLATKILRDYHARYGAIAEQVYGGGDDGFPLIAGESSERTALLQRLYAKAAIQGYGYQCMDDGSYQMSSPIGTVEIAPYHAAEEYYDAGDLFRRYQHSITVGDPAPCTHFLLWHHQPPAPDLTDKEMEDLVAYFEAAYDLQNELGPDPRGADKQRAQCDALVQGGSEQLTDEYPYGFDHA